MAGYSTSNPPFRLFSGVTGATPTVWGYKSVDASATVRAASYITNGGALGMKVGDLVICWDSATPQIFCCQVLTVSSTYPGAVDLSDATAIGVATNS